MAAHREQDYDLILGNLICDRLGLNPHTVARDGFTHERVGNATVMIRATVMQTIPAEDMLELEALAHARWMAGETRD